jgi:hypothetical protein
MRFRSFCGVLIPRHVVVAACAAFLIAPTMMHAGFADNPDDERQGPASYTIALFGDMPYNPLGGRSIPVCLRISTRVTWHSLYSMAT